ncbi:hypothetical protein [Ruminococcus bicirculans (ex Wegman et al. 2014)]|jgi:hypothetical protein|uniref:hypothetical protein n=1 Tax=Ruminococcus bicirculans (ex Wegman et al. 2014) TaxID=1160721 RepID=UPI00402566B7
MIEYVELELLKAVRCEKCGNILLWKGNIAGRSMAFFDEEMIKDLQNLIHCTEQDEYGDDTKELKICDLHNIYDLEKKSSENNKEHLTILQNIIGDLENSTDVKAAIIFKRPGNDERKSAAICISIILLIIMGIIPLNIIMLKAIINRHPNIFSIVFWGSEIMLVLMGIMMLSLLFLIPRNRSKSKTFLILSTTTFSSCESCGTPSEATRRFINFEKIIVGTRAFKNAEIPAEHTILSIGDLNRLYKSVKKYDPPYIDIRHSALLAINDCIKAMKEDGNVRVKMIYAGDNGK